MNEFVRFIDDGTIEKLRHKVYEQYGVVGVFHHWEFNEGRDVMVCVRLK